MIEKTETQNHIIYNCSRCNRKGYVKIPRIKTMPPAALPRRWNFHWKLVPILLDIPSPKTYFTTIYCESCSNKLKQLLVFI